MADEFFIKIGGKPVCHFLTRRDFLKEFGVVSLLCMTPSTTNGLLFCLPMVKDHATPSDALAKSGSAPLLFYSPPVKSQAVLFHDFRACVVGTGIASKKLGFKLSKIGGHNMTCNQNRPKPRLDIFSFHPANIVFNHHLKDRDLIFLTGSVEDRNFWIARKLILSANPYLLMTLVRVCPETSVMKMPFIPGENECWINLPSDGFGEMALNIIRDVYSSIVVTGLIGLDFTDIHDIVSEARGVGFFIESPLSSHVSRFKELVRRNVKTFVKANGAYVVFSYDHRENLNLNDISDMTNTLTRTMRKDANIILGLDTNRTLATNFRATVLLASIATKKGLSQSDK